jgi:hypothetical protein
MSTVTTTTPCRRYDNEAGRDSVERLTLIECEDFGDGDVGFHVSPQMDDVLTVMLSVEDGWRFLREFTRALVQAENE